MSERPDTPAVATRRRQLQKWIDAKFDGSKVRFVESTNDGTRQLNQGELSGLLRRKSFGEKRARSLEVMAKMPAGFLDQESNGVEEHDAYAPLPTAAPGSMSNQTWPFPEVSLERLFDLQRQLGPKSGAEAMADIASTLETAVLKWENRIPRREKAA